MLCIYYPLSDVVKRGNITPEERMTLLESYSHCMKHNFKEITKEAADRRKDLQDILLKNLCFKSESENNSSTSAINGCETSTDNIVYDLCGYLLYARSNMIAKLTDSCKNCTAKLETKRDLLPKDFYAGKLVEIRERYGGLKYCTTIMFEAFKEIEKQIQRHLQSENAYLRDSFSTVIESISHLTLSEIGCTLHREILAPKLIYEYVVFRYRFHAKQEKKIRLEKSKSDRKGKKKLSKLAKAPSTKKIKSTDQNESNLVVVLPSPSTNELNNPVNVKRKKPVKTVTATETVPVKRRRVATQKANKSDDSIR